MIFENHRVCNDTVWTDIENMIANRAFPWEEAKLAAALRPQYGKQVDIQAQVWCQLLQYDEPRVSALCTYNRVMFFYKPPSTPNALLCSKTYNFSGKGHKSHRFMLTAVLLAARRDAGGPAIGDVAFGNWSIPLNPSTVVVAHRAELWARDAPSVCSDLDASLPQQCKLDNVITVQWEPFPTLGLRAYAVVPLDHLLAHGDTLRCISEQVPVPPGAKPANATVVVDKVIVDNRIGSVCAGFLRGGRRVVIKVSDDSDGWRELCIEALNYHQLTKAGLAKYIPYCYGIWQDVQLTMLIVDHVGASLEHWSDLDDKQWVVVCSALRVLHATGYHHGDLLPRNVCIDDAGQLRFIDLACVEKCTCHLQCMDILQLERDSGRSIV